MKKLSKVIFASFVLLGVCFLTACNTKTDDKPDDDKDKPQVVLRKALESIQLDTTGVKLEYYLGQAFDSTGLKVQAKFANNTTEDVSSSVVVNSDSFDSNSLGKYSIVVSYTYEGRVRTGNYTVEVKSILDNNIKHLVGLNIIFPQVPGSEEGQTKDKEYVYSVGDDFDVSDVTFEARYSDDSTTPLSADDVEKNFEGIDKTTAGNYTAVFSKTESYTDNGVTQEVTVKNFVIVTYLNPLTGLKLKSGTVEVDFGSEFNTTDWVVEATYKNGDTYIIPAGQYSVSDVSTIISGEQVVTVAYTEMGVTRTCKVTVTVGKNPDANQPIVIEFNASELDEVATQISTPLKYGDYITYICKKVDSNTKELDGVTYTKRLNFGGKASALQNMGVIMPGAGTIEVVYSASINEGDERCIAVYDSAFNELQRGDAVKVRNAVQKYTFEISEAGTYYLGSTLSGMYIYGATITIYPAEND